MKIYQVVIVDYYDDNDDLTIGYATTEAKARTMIDIAKIIYGSEQSYAYWSASVDTMIINGNKVMV